MQGTGHAVAEAVDVQPDIELDGYPTLFRDLFLTFRSRGVSREESQDLAQETILRTLVHLRRHGRSAEDLGPLVRTIGRNLFIERIRRAKPEVVELSDAIVDDAPEPVEVVVESERREEIQAALQSLTPRHRHVVTLWMQGLTPGQIARELGIKRNAADAILHRARRRLASVLEGSRGAFALIAIPSARLRLALRSASQTLASMSPASAALASGGASLATFALAAALYTASPMSDAVRTPPPTTTVSNIQNIAALTASATDGSGSSETSTAPRSPEELAKTDVNVQRQDLGVEVNPAPGDGDETGLGIERQDSGGQPGKVGSALDGASDLVCGGAPVCEGNR